ncbi:MAG: nitrogenase component 1, partial [Thermodesulfobacteriota bacterium]
MKTDDLMKHACATRTGDGVCRSRGGESCAFDGAMIVLQCIADAAHLVHGPIACLGNSWDSRGTISDKGDLHRRAYTTDLTELDIIHGAGEKLMNAILRVRQDANPRAIFVYATCVSGLIGEDVEGVCRRAAEQLDIPVIPVNSPGFVGPKNLGNRIAGEALLNHVIGTGEPERLSGTDINLVGEYNIAGDLQYVEPVLEQCGIRLLSRMTGNSRYMEITHAHRARLNVMVCSRALINVAREMEIHYGIPYIEASFFGPTQIRKAVTAIGEALAAESPWLPDRIEHVLATREEILREELRPYAHLKGQKAVLYSGGVKSWAMISALFDLGIEVVAVGTKKSTVEDEEKMRDLVGPEVPLVESMTPAKIRSLMAGCGATLLVAGGRNRYLAAKEGYAFVDVNQERHHAYAGYDGFLNLASDISSSLAFYSKHSRTARAPEYIDRPARKEVSINPLRHSPAIGGALAFQGIDRAVTVLHGAQGCNFLGKVLLTKHFMEPISMFSTKLFSEDVVMGAADKLGAVLRDVEERQKPDITGI